MQGRNREADIEKRVVDIMGKGEGGMKCGSSIETYTLPCSHRQVAEIFCINTWTQPALQQPRGMDGQQRGMEVQEGGVYVYLWLIYVVWQHVYKFYSTL